MTEEQDRALLKTIADGVQAIVAILSIIAVFAGVGAGMAVFHTIAGQGN